MTSSPSDWQMQGFDHIWLPYTQMKHAGFQPAIIGAKGCELHLDDGRTLIDGIASWWTMAHGYQHPHLVTAVQKQAETLSHVMFGGLAHEPAYKLAKRLTAFAPKRLERVFFADSGSIAVEISLKMAMQYWRNHKQPRKQQFLCFKNGYHGDTFGAMSVGDARSDFAKAYANSLTHQFLVDLPRDEYDFAEFESIVADNHKSIAACIIEPLMQGAGGIKFYPPDVLAEIYRICKQYDILFIADEIATGFYRTGTRFACDEAGITPDIMTVGKALTGGMMTMAAALATDEVFEAFLSDDFASALMHGPTYMANPLACSAALASLDLFEAEDYGTKVEAIETQLRQQLAPCRNSPHMQEVRVKGAAAALQISPDKMDILALRQKFIKKGVWIRPFGDVIYIMPPLTINAEELTTLTTAICEVVAEL